MVKDQEQSSSQTSSDGKKKRRPPTNVRHANKENKFTKVGNSKIYYLDDKVIGHGATAIVYEGYFKDPETKVAVKRVFTKYADVVKRELKIWKDLCNGPLLPEKSYIVYLYNHIEFYENQENNHYFAMELANKNLEEMLQQLYSNEDPKWRDKVILWIEEAAKGLSWLHEKRVIHRDVKPENILIFFLENGKTIAKLGDFGISKRISGPSELGTNSVGKGTENWMAPEVIESYWFNEEIQHTKAVDCFSFGMMCHYALTLGQEHPFGRSRKYGASIANNIRDSTVAPLKLGNEEYEANNAFQWMMSHEPKTRLSIRLMLEHPLFWPAKRKISLWTYVAKSLYEKNMPELDKIKREIDSGYRQSHLNFDWKLTLGEECTNLLLRRKSSDAIKKYNYTSLISLLHLVRDKEAHSSDLKEELLTDSYFGIKDRDNEWTYSKVKFSEFFCKAFPDLTVFLFEFLVQNKDNKKLKAVKANFKLNQYTLIPYPSISSSSEPASPSPKKRKTSTPKKKVDDKQIPITNYFKPSSSASNSTTCSINQSVEQMDIS